MTRAPLAALSLLVTSMTLATGAGAAKNPVVYVGQTVHLAGSPVYCEVIVVSRANFVSCALERSGGGVAKSFTFAVGDQAVLVGQVGSGATQTVYMQQQPALKLSPAERNEPRSGTVLVTLDHGVAVSGTHVVLGAVDLLKGEPGLFAGIQGADGNPVNGSYVAEISAKRLAVTHWSGGKASVVYQTLQPASR